MRTAILILVCVLPWGSAAPSRSPARGGIGESGLTTALLVGCTRYPFLARDRWLEGPANDVELLKRLLTDGALGPPPDSLRVLVGWPEDEAERPTRGNILGAIDSFAKSARPGESFLLYLAGHGSQQPDADGDEIDGWDEIFLPADVSGWNGQRGVVENAISDDEIWQRLETLRKRGVFVWLLVDACNSGTFSRGGPSERERRIEPEALIAAEALAKIRTPPRSRGVDIRTTPFDFGSAEGLVAMYASMPHELTVESELPRGGGRYQGIFTYTLAKVLMRSSGSLSFRELTDAIAARYRASGRSFPTPVIEGGAQDRQVFGRGEGLAPRPIRLGRNRDGLTVDVGEMTGYGSGTVFSVLAPGDAAAGAEHLGFVEVVTVRPFSSTVVPVAFEDRAAAAADRLPSGARCEVILARQAAAGLRVGLQTGTDVIADHAPGEGPEPLEKLLASAKTAQSSWQRARDPGEADWFLRRRGDDLVLVPAAGEPTGAARSDTFRLGRADSAEGLAGDLASALDRIARTTRLLRLAANPMIADGPRVDVELVRFDGREDAGSSVPFEVGGRVLHVDDEIAFRATNRYRGAVDVTLLFVDRTFGILSVFPSRQEREYNRLKPGESITTPRFRVTADTTGAEQLVTISVRANSSTPVEFSHLEQRRVQTMRGGVERFATPLEAFVSTAVDGTGRTRGLARQELSSYSMNLLQWQTVPIPRTRTKP